MKTIIMSIMFILMDGAFGAGSGQDSINIELERLAQKYELASQDKMMILFYNLGECPSCYFRIFDELEFTFKNRAKLPFKLIFVAFVNVEREVELKSFARQHKYFDEVRINRNYRKSIGLADSIIALTIDRKFQIIDTFSGLEKNIFQKIQKGGK